jgi:hypothetical protein
MKPNELRIGNYIQHSEDSIWGCIDKFYGDEVYIDDWHYGTTELKECEPIKLNKEWLLKFEFEKWDASGRYSNEFESYERWVLHNRLDGTSDFEVHLITSTYGGGEPYLQTVCSIDEDERINTQYNLEYVHQMQNLFFALTGEELVIC